MSARANTPEITILLLAGVAATSFFTLAPALIGSLIDGMHLSVRAVGWVASCQLTGSALGNLCTLLLGRKLSVRHTLTASLAAAGLANLATLLARDFFMLLVCCLASGLAGGVAYSVVNAAAARLPRPGVMFAAISIAQMLFGAIGFVTLPPLIAPFGPDAIFATLGSYALACAVAAVRLTGPATVHDSGWRASLSLTSRGAVLLVARLAGETGGDARILVALLAMYLGLIGGPLLGASLVIGLDYQVLILVAAASFAAASLLTLGARRPSMQWVTP